MVDGRRLIAEVVGFGRALHDAGVGGDTPATARFAQALTLVDVGRRDDVRAAGATVFVKRYEELAAYDAVFDAWWRSRAADAAPIALRLGGHADDRSTTAAGERPITHAGDAAAGDADLESLGVRGRYSAVELLRRREFERMTPAELREAERLIDLLAPRLQLRRSRREQFGGRGGKLAPRQMFRHNLATGGDPLDWVWRRPRREPRSVVVLCDVSGSMERHARLLLRFVHALSRANASRTEVFVFGTRLTRVTRLLRARDADAALARVADTVVDWSGGTRIGAALREFNVHWARRVLTSSGMVIVVSDGWDRGDSELVRSEAARLRRNCHRLVWLNPMAGEPGYEPLAAGMAAAYPYVDDFMPVRTLASLEHLAGVLGGQRP